MEKLLSRAMKEHTPLEIIYLSNNQTFTQRKIIINSIDQNDLHAYCFLRRQIRRFKISNILSAFPAKYRNKK